MAVVTRLELPMSLPAPQWPARWQGLEPPSARAELWREFALLLQGATVRGIAVLALAGAAFALFSLGRPTPHVATSAAPPPMPTPMEKWAEIDHPAPLYALDSEAFGKTPQHYEAQSAAPSGGRRDMLAFGRFGGSDPYLYLSLYRIGAEKTARVPFFVALARPAAEAGLAVIRSDRPGLLATRFGPFEVADVMLAQPAAQAECLGFRFDSGSPRFQIAGLACGGAGTPIERHLLACSLDRLTLVSPGADLRLARLFKAATQARDTSCGERRPENHAVRKKALW